MDGVQKKENLKHCEAHEESSSSFFFFCLQRQTARVTIRRTARVTAGDTNRAFQPRVSALFSDTVPGTFPECVGQWAPSESPASLSGTWYCSRRRCPGEHGITRIIAYYPHFNAWERCCE